VNLDVAFSPDLVAWLNRDDHEPVTEWEPEPPGPQLRCAPRLVARLAEVARPIGHTGRRFVDGCPVVHHPNGRPIAAAAGTNRLTTRTAEGWIELDPWGPDIAFARVVDLLRAHVARAYELAGSES
jgi:hypothetical protein